MGMQQGSSEGADNGYSGRGTSGDAEERRERIDLSKVEHATISDGGGAVLDDDPLPGWPGLAAVTAGEDAPVRDIRSGEVTDAQDGGPLDACERCCGGGWDPVVKGQLGDNGLCLACGGTGYRRDAEARGMAARPGADPVGVVRARLAVGAAPGAGTAGDAGPVGPPANGGLAEADGGPPTLTVLGPCPRCGGDDEECLLCGGTGVRERLLNTMARLRATTPDVVLIRAAFERLRQRLAWVEALVYLPDGERGAGYDRALVDNLARAVDACDVAETVVSVECGL